MFKKKPHRAKEMDVKSQAVRRVPFYVFLSYAASYRQASMQLCLSYVFGLIPRSPDIYLSTNYTLLAVYADGSAIGKRNYAILTILARLGIRASEVAHFQLNDIDWFQGSILIRAGKSHRDRLLPLAGDVGQALLDYLRDGRPKTPYRELFLEHYSPYCRRACIML
ncbi:MAG: tyrosine-type recombinase/integrase, partial [Chloracidobacterium sp.]|nr:tyrosine-type recombinase/integrase [Chloracidobacterium sp.]